MNSCLLQHRTELLLYPVSIFIVLYNHLPLYCISPVYFSNDKDEMLLLYRGQQQFINCFILQWPSDIIFGISDRFIYWTNAVSAVKEINSSVVLSFIALNFFLEKMFKPATQQFNGWPPFHFCRLMKTACECSYVSTIRRVKFQTTGQT